MTCKECGKKLFLAAWPFCPHEPIQTRDALIHARERVQVLTNPETGETRIEGRVDRPIHPKYKAAGFTERRELTTLADVRRLEKEKNFVHEASNYDNSGRQERDTGSV